MTSALEELIRAAKAWKVSKDGYKPTAGPVKGLLDAVERYEHEMIEPVSPTDGELDAVEEWYRGLMKRKSESEVPQPYVIEEDALDALDADKHEVWGADGKWAPAGPDGAKTLRMVLYDDKGWWVIARDKPPAPSPKTLRSKLEDAFETRGVKFESEVAELAMLTLEDWWESLSDDVMSAVSDKAIEVLRKAQLGEEA